MTKLNCIFLVVKPKITEEKFTVDLVYALGNPGHIFVITTYRKGNAYTYAVICCVDFRVNPERLTLHAAIQAH